MKKLIPILLLICICLTGCSLQKEYDLCGKEQIEAFRAEAQGWTSARYLLTNLETDETDQVFSFMNNADGTQTYLYEKIVDGSYYAEYSGGGMFCVLSGTDVTCFREGDEGYAEYTAEKPHPYSTGELLFYVNLYVESSDESTDEQGNVTYTYIYSTDKINESLGTSLTSFVTAYSFDKDGNFLYFTQSNSDGENEYAYMIETWDINSITEIENPALEQ